MTHVQRQRALQAAQSSLRMLHWNLLQADGSDAYEALACYVDQFPAADPVVTQWYRMTCENSSEQGEFYAVWYAWQQETRHTLGLTRGW